ncbi:hypothetical protein TRVA0_033S01222 [Trichomonascus vanleenenianus]|uniref:cyclin family protein n=1 Tax=Trichomonascus vanleenenianus TaxID=2268995 RepID=UPI003ECA04B8
MPLLGRRKKDKAAAAAKAVPEQPPQPQAQQQASPNSNITNNNNNAGGAGSPVGIKTVPRDFFQCPIGDLVVLVTSMLQELVELNDALPFDAENLTRFHSRSPPGISLYDYVVRIVKFCSLEKSILLSIIYFIDLLCTTYTTFSINSLTVHRFLITAAMVGTKGLCDSFCTNSYYARVGGLSKVELNLLEVEFLVRVDYRIVPTRECLNQYYENMVSRLDGRYKFEEETTPTAASAPHEPHTVAAPPPATPNPTEPHNVADATSTTTTTTTAQAQQQAMAVDSEEGEQRCRANLKRPPDVIPNSGIHHLFHHPQHHGQHIPPTSPKRFRGR